ncbi:MAG TPA: hypothetical protein VL283_05355 [Candidatus Baltobacteraceae bacterium]|nr:hypothetical protein [Candidatus Baltobacteraceae bacterium]
MSGKKPPPPTALVRRASPDLSDADLAALLHRRHLLDRKHLRGMFDPDRNPRMRFYDEDEAVSGASYVIYSETTQRFIGFRRGVVYHLDGSETSRRMQLVFFPAAQA